MKRKIRYTSCSLGTNGLAHFMTLVTFYPLEYIRKPFSVPPRNSSKPSVFWYFQRVLKETSGINPSRPNPRRREKNKLNFYFRTFLWYLKRFYEGLKGLQKTFWGTTKKWEKKNLTYFLFQYDFQKCTGREGLDGLMMIEFNLPIYFIFS